MGADETRLELTVGPDGALLLDGEIDTYTAPGLAARLAAEPDVDVVDLAGVSFIDSSGLRVLVQIHQTRTAAGDTLTLRSPSASVQRLLEISGLATHLDCGVAQTALGWPRPAWALAADDVVRPHPIGSWSVPTVPPTVTA